MSHIFRFDDYDISFSTENIELCLSDAIYAVCALEALGWVMVTPVL